MYLFPSIFAALMITWFEIPAFDFEKSVDFYSRVFGLKIEVTSFGSVPYGLMKDEAKGINGALFKVKEKPAPNEGPVLFFKVHDMSETIRKILLHGGVILKPKSIIRNETMTGSTVIPRTAIDNEVGYYAIFRDPSENRMALYSNS